MKHTNNIGKGKLISLVLVLLIILIGTKSLVFSLSDNPDWNSRAISIAYLGNGHTEPYNMRQWILSDTAGGPGEIAFCVEIHQGMYGDFNHYKGTLVSSIMNNYGDSRTLAQSKANAAARAIRQGWVTQPKTDLNYAITQVAVWDIISPENDVTAIGVNEADIAALVNYAKDLKHTTPSFDGQTISLSVGETKILSDSNHVITALMLNNDYQMGVEKRVLDQAFALTLLENDQVKIRLLNPVATSTLSMIFPGTDPLSIVSYNSVESQDTVLGTLTVQDPSSLRLNIELAAGEIAFTKTNPTGVPFTDARFELRDASGAAVKFSQESAGVYSKNSSGTLSSLALDANGKLRLKAIEPGTYSILETARPTGTNQPAPVSVIVVSGQTATASLTNTLVQGRIQVTKKDRSTNANLAGAVFTVTSKARGAVVATLTTAADGTATTGLLDYGIYTVKETQAPVGYVLDPANATELFLAENLQTYSYTATNKIIEGDIALSKTDTKTGQALEGVVYEVSNAAGVVVSTLTTDALGQARTALLPYGIYTVKEVKGAASYILNGAGETANIDVEGETETRNYTNTQQLFGLKFQKQDLVNGSTAVGEASLVGAEFTVTVEALVRTGVTGQKQPGETVGVYTTDANGQFAIDDLPLGIYKIQESKAPLGYQLNPNPIYVRGMVQVEGISIAGFPKQVSESEMRALAENNGAQVVVAHSALVYYTDHTAALITAADHAITKVEIVKNSLLPEDEIGTLVMPRVSSTVAGTDGLIPLVNLGLYGRIELTKHADNHNPDTEDSALNSAVKEPEVGVEFQIIDAKDMLVETLTTNYQGKAASGLLPYGDYTLHQVVGTGNYPTLLPIADMAFSISKNGQVISFVAENQPLRMRVQVSKFDEETQKAILHNGATFEIYRSDDSQVVMHSYYPTPSQISEFTTNSEGYFETPGRLLPGDYYLVETKAPVGYYVTAGHKIPFTVPANLPTDQAIIIDVQIGEEVEQMVGVDVPNTAQFGKLSINKTAELFERWAQEIVKVLVPESGTLIQPIVTADPVEPKEIESEVKTEVVIGGRVVINGLYEGVPAESTTTASTTSATEATAARAPSAATSARPIPITETATLASAEATNAATTATSTEVTTETTTEVTTETTTEATEVGFLSGGSTMNMIPVEFDKNGAKGETLKIVGQAGSEKVDLTLVFGETVSPITLKAGKYDLSLAGVTTSYYVQTSALVTLTQTRVSKAEIVMIHNPKYVEDAEAANETTTVLEGALIEKEFTVNKPVYTSKILAGVGFELIAAEDLYSFDGQSKFFSAGDVVKSGTTAAGEELVFTDIPLGKYRLVEKSAPSGYLLDPTVYEVEFTPEEQCVLFTLKNTSEIVNKRQILNVKMNKTMAATPLFHHENGALKDVTFGVYTNESIQGLAKDSLIAVVKPAMQADPDQGIAIGDMIVGDLLPGSYYFKEFSTNGNYVLDEQNFLIKVSFVEGLEESLTTTAEPVTNVPKTGELLLSKADVETGVLLTGARFEIYGLTNEGTLIPVLNQVGENDWSVDENGQLSWENLEMGRYRFIETAAPVGYVSARNPLDIEVTENDTVTRVTFNNSPSEVSILKIDQESEAALASVELELYDLNGKLIDKWTSTTEAHVIKRLVVGGTYVLREIKSAAGYATTKDVSFTVKDEAMVQGVVISNTKTTVEIRKQDAGTGAEIPGASMKLTDTAGKTVVEWISSEVPFVIRGLEVGKTYTLHEDLAPLGYVVANSIDFMIANTEGKQEVVMIDELTTAEFSKQDGTTGAELPGASMKITDRDGKTVEAWTSGDTVHIVRGLYEGERYTLHEDLAPAGYSCASSISFTMGDGKKVTMIDELTRVILEKDDVTNGKPVPGAEITVYDEKGNEVFKGFTDDHGQTQIIGLDGGKTYRFKESIHPFGYILNKNIFTFKLNKDGSVEGTTEFSDEPTRFEIKKTDDKGQAIKDVGFQLFTDAGVKIYWTLQDGIWIADANGAHDTVLSSQHGDIFMHYLPVGKYVLKENFTPEGYKAAADRNIDLTAEHGTSSALKISVMNEQIPAPVAPILPRTGENDPKLPLAKAAGGLSFALAASILFMKRQLKARNRA